MMVQKMHVKTGSLNQRKPYERQLKVHDHNYLLYASNNTTGIAKNAMTMLEAKLGGDYQQIKAHLISMFDNVTKQQIMNTFKKPSDR